MQQQIGEPSGLSGRPLVSKTVHRSALSWQRSRRFGHSVTHCFSARTSTLLGFFDTTDWIMDRGQAKLPGAVVGGLILAIVLDTIIQITWKLAVAGVPGNASVAATAREVLSNPLFCAAMLAFGAQLFNWVRVLARADLSFAQPFTALSYISVLAISAHSLHESIPSTKALGVILILVGVFFISRTPFRTANICRPEGKNPDSPRS